MIKNIHQFYARIFQHLMFVLLAIFMPYLYADSCQYIIDSGSGFMRLKSYEIPSNLIVNPVFTSAIEVEGEAKIITVSENNRFVLVTSELYDRANRIISGVTNIYRVNNKCQLLSTPVQKIHWGNGSIPTAVLQNDDKFYIAFINNPHPSVTTNSIKGYHFNGDYGKIEEEFADISEPSAVTSMAYNLDKSILYVATGKSILGYRYSLSSGYNKLPQIYNFGFEYTPAKILSFGNFLFVMKNNKNDNTAPYFVASYIFGSDNNILVEKEKFNVYSGEAPLDMQVTYAPDVPEYGPPGLSNKYSLFTTTGIRIYKYAVTGLGVLDGNALIGLYKPDDSQNYSPNILASTWSVERYTSSKIMGRTPFRVLAIQYDAQHQTVFFLHNKVVSIVTYVLNSIINPIAMTIAEAPSP